jgi:hypothetical protein
MKICDNCRFWSQMVAQSIGLSGVEALCLSDTSPHSGAYTRRMSAAPNGGKTLMAAVDEPPDYGETARALYTAEEGTDEGF